MIPKINVATEKNEMGIFFIKDIIIGTPPINTRNHPSILTVNFTESPGHIAITSPHRIAMIPVKYDDEELICRLCIRIELIMVVKI